MLKGSVSKIREELQLVLADSGNISFDSAQKNIKNTETLFVKRELYGPARRHAGICENC